jgi:hypothetical protein
MALVILAIILFVLFGISFLSKRRFGTLGLGLAAGALLASELSREMALFLQQFNISLLDFSSVALASMILILLPPLVLLVSGPVYENKKTALIGSLAFALMGTMLMMGPISTGFPMTDRNTSELFNFTAMYESRLVASGVVLAVIDSWLTHNFKPLGKKKH